MVYILACVWYSMPAYVGNMAPVFAKMIFKDRFSKPVDLGRNYKGKRITGNNKTFRGFLSAILMSVMIVLIQREIYISGNLTSVSVMDYSSVNFILFGFLMGFGAMFGDLVKSVFKRRLDKESGSSWMPFDQIDFLLGAILITSIVYTPPMTIIIGILVLMPIIKVVVDNIGVCLGVYDQRW